MLRAANFAATLALLLAILSPSTLPAYPQPLESPIILDPTYSVTQIVRPGGWFTACIRDPSGALSPSSDRASLLCYIGGAVNLSVSQTTVTPKYF